MIDVRWQDYITADPAVMVGKPIIKGTRITVELIVEKLGYGETVDEILEDYPHLSREQIYACLRFCSSYRTQQTKPQISGMIQLLADENVEGRVIHLLRSEGYTVTSIQETQSGVADERVLATAVSSATVLLTGDSDFGKLHFQKGHIHSGILFYRLPRTTTEEKGQIILKTIRTYGDKLIDAFTVVTANKVRTRKL